MKISVGSEWVRCCGQHVTVAAVAMTVGSERLQIEGGERVIVRDEPQRWRQRTMLTATFRANYEQTDGPLTAAVRQWLATPGAPMPEIVANVTPGYR